MQSEMEQIVEKMKPYIRDIIRNMLREMIGAKPAMVSSVDTEKNTCVLLIRGDTNEKCYGIKILPGVSIAPGDWVMMEYKGNISGDNPFVRTKL